MSTIDATLAERGSRYGEFDEHARVTQNIKAAFGDSKNWIFLDDDQKECLEMIAHKVGRILNGDPDYIDSWTDIIGYTRLVEKRLIAQSPGEDTLGPAKAAEAGTGCDDLNCIVCHPETAEGSVILDYITAALRAGVAARDTAKDLLATPKTNVKT